MARRKPLDVDFTPLIDVTFLLLIFFMVTTTLAQPTEVKLPRASSGKGEVSDDKVIVHIRAGDAEQRVVRLGTDEDTALPLNELALNLKAIGASSAMVRADAEVPFTYVDEVASTLRGEGLGKVMLGVREQEFIK